VTELTRQLTDVTIQQVESYLAAKRWKSDGEIRKVATVWHQHDSLDAEVVLPLSTSVKDYTQRLRDALAALALYEQRQIVDVVSDVVRYFANVISVRVIGADTSEGTIPISDGVLLITKAKELLYAAAMSMYAKKKQFSGAPSKDTKSYVDALLLGQTEVGSYVVNVIAPLRPNTSPKSGGDEVQLAQAVTLSLANSLEALINASNDYGLKQDPTVFEAAIAKGASANMCDALLGFSGTEHNREFEIRISGAAGPMFEGETKIFLFNAGYVIALQKASSYYKDDYVLRDREIWGFVKKLHRPKGDENGTITVESTVDQIERNVNIELGPDDYHKSILAHDKKSAVKCRGDIHVKSRSATLLNPTDFKVVASMGELF
jgi:hypothetical protein